MADKKYSILLTAADQTRAAFDSANRNVERMSGGLFSLQSLLASVSAVGMVALVRSSTDAADAMSKSAQKIGTTTEALSRLKYAAELSDLPFESLEKSLTKLSRAAYDSATTGGASSVAFNQLGIAVKDATGNLKDSPALMSEIAAKFAVMQDGSAKTALAMSLFGKSGADMIPLLNSGSAGLKQMADEADRLGIVIDSSTGLAAEQFNDNLTRMGKAGEGAADTITAALLPAMNEVAAAFVGTAKDGAALGAVTATIKTAFEAVVILGSDVAFVFKTIGNSIGGTAAQIAAFASGDFAGVARINKMMLDDAKKSREELDAFQQRILNPPAAIAPEKRSGAAPAIENDPKIKAAAAAAAKARQKLADEDDKYWIEKAKKEYAHGEKQTIDMVNKQQERFVALRQQAEEVGASDLEIEQLKQDRELSALETQRQMLATDHELSLAELEAFEQAKADIILAHSGALREATLNDDRRIVDGKIQYQKISLNSMGAFFGMAKGLMNSHSRAAFELGKAAAISETLINTYKSATAAYAAMASIPWVGPALGIAAAAAAVVSGMAQVSAIQSTSFGSSGAGGGSYGGASSSTAGGAATPNFPIEPAPSAAARQVPNITINLGDSAFMPTSAVRALIEQINEAIGDGATLRTE